MRTLPDTIADKQLRGDEPLVPAWEINAGWRTAWLRAIARAWREEQDAESQEKAGKIPTKAKAERFQARLVEDAELTLQDVGFAPSSFLGNLLDIEVKTYRGEKHYNGDNPKVNGWKDMGNELRATLVLTVPPKPKDPASFAVALADYDAGGRVYPFTMC